MSYILGIDPGQAGAFVFLKKDIFEYEFMPLKNDTKDVDFLGVQKVLKSRPILHVFLERAIPFAMGAKSAFNYGRGFAALELAVFLAALPVTYLEPAKWTKEMHQGIQDDLKPKAKSLIAVNRLFPHLVFDLPCGKKGKTHDGVVDALLIAEYGRKKG